MGQFTRWRKINALSCIHFVTTNTFGHHPFFLDYNCCDILLNNIRQYRKKLGFEILGYAIMPDHFHGLFWFDVEKHETKALSPNGVGSGLPRTNNCHNLLSKDAPLNISKIIHRIKGKTAVDIRNELHIIFKWQKYFYDFNIYTYKKYLEKLNYIHNNQFKDARILHPYTYPYSSMIFLETGKGALKIDEIEL